ncbi:MAG TPA: ATP-binding protein [Gammaproteobacteria bacterium]|jgi:AAA15 family ATPase/GTPase|nr:ATP-binding protein [Gammaproteobacteria bacterium]
MLIEFKIANYRSIRESQTLSMVAAKDISHQDTNCMQTGVSGLPHLIRSAVLYGANASGKSNFISALAFMKSMVETSAVSIREGQTLNISPFRLDPKTATKPTEFEIIIIEDGIRYQYGFEVNATRVTKEWLFACINRKPQLWFERQYDVKKNKDTWNFGSHLLGGKQRNLWSESTRGNALFLSTAVNLNSEQLRPIFNWFVNKLIIIENNAFPHPFYTMECIKQERDKPKIIELLQAADLGITDVQIKMQKGQQIQVRLESGTAAIEHKQEMEVPSATFFHEDKNKNPISFTFEEESHGTQKLFAYAGPILDVLRNGKILIVDELDSSLHQKMVRFLICLIQNADLNKNGAQLFFTTHNTSLLDMDLFRRDQIWFMERNQEQESHLYPLTDFSPRKGEALEKGYLLGRYGALPFFGEFNL